MATHAKWYQMIFLITIWRALQTQFTHLLDLHSVCVGCRRRYPVRPASYAGGRFDVVLIDIGIECTWRAVAIGQIVLGCSRGGSEHENESCVAFSH